MNLDVTLYSAMAYLTSPPPSEYSESGLRRTALNLLFRHNSMKSVRFHSKPISLFALLMLLLSACLLTSCSSLINSFFVEPAVSNLQKQTDFRLVCEGGPSYLLMVDSLIDSDPEDPSLLMIGAKAYSAYLSVLAECSAGQERLAAISDKARLYGTALLSRQLPIAPGDSIEVLDKALKAATACDVELLFWGTAAWTSWVFQQQGSPASMADLVKIEKIMLTLVELDETFGDGSIHLVLGSYYGAKPKLIGGKPALAKEYFEKGLSLSERRYLPLQTAYAQTYCRMTMNKKLHDNLLKEVIAFPLRDAPEHALANQVAKAKAYKLLKENFFDE